MSGPPPLKREREPDPYVGQVIDGRFRLLSLLGRGGMGLVYRAEQAPLGRSVALKLLVGTDLSDNDRESQREEELRQRFYREAATAARLRHQNTITVFDYGADRLGENPVLWIAMELLEGQTLARVMGKGALSPARAMQIGLQVCRSLREAHSKQIIHRDLKPGNIMLLRQEDADDQEGDFVKVLDFGLAKTFLGPGEPALTKAGTFLGSPRYVAPEQVEGRAVDPRTDIYSLGCVLYRMVTGRVPFDGESPVEIMLKHLDQPPPLIVAPEVPGELCELIHRCLAKNANDRPQGMQEVITALKRIRAQQGFRQGPSWEEPSDIELSGPMAAQPGEAISAPVPELSDPGGEIHPLVRVRRPTSPPTTSLLFEESVVPHVLEQRRGSRGAWALLFGVSTIALVMLVLVGQKLGWWGEVSTSRRGSPSTANAPAAPQP
ncbi:MAG: serine/threonine-protein kinase [Myxococcota bacterium]